MKHELTYNDLYQIDQDLQSVSKTHPSIKLLLAGQIALFYQVAESHLQRMKEGFDVIKEKYIKKDAAGNFLVTGDDNNKEWDYLDCKRDIAKAKILIRSEVKALFNAEAKQFFSKKITLPI